MVCALLAGFTPDCVRAAQDIGLAQFGIDRWDQEDGLGSNWVRGLVEDPDGTIWIGTGVGLKRFDGRTFAPTLDGGLGAMPQRAVTSIARGRDGSLWVGLQYGGVRRIGGPTPPALPDGLVVHRLLEDGAGRLWVATNRGLWRIDGERAEPVSPHPGAEAAEINGLAAGPDGEVWARSAWHGLWRIAQDAIAIVPDAPGCRGFDIAVGPDGERFMSCREDFAWLAGVGINAVRIPVGHWLFGPPYPYHAKYGANPHPFVAGGVEVLDRAMAWAAEFGLGVVLDLHAAPVCHEVSPQ